MHLLSSPQEQRGYGWEYLTGCYHLFILPQAIYLTLSKISRVTFPQTRSFDVLRPNFFSEKCPHTFQRQKPFYFIRFVYLALLCSLIFLTSLIDGFFFKTNKGSYLYLPFCWRQCVMTQMEPVVCCILRECEMNHIAFWYSLTLSVCDLLLIVYNCFKVWFPFYWFSWN